MSKQRYGRPSTGQKGNNRPTVVISRENYDEVDSLSIGTGMSRSAIVDYFISEDLKRARIEEVVIKTKRLVLEDLGRRNKNILRLVVRKSPTGESTHYFFHSQDDKVEVSC
ncbi:hypothetical protein ABZ559_07770 [Streptococcus sp. ZY19097]|uniref:hypothetical protein n=1 Tax=Streptococcus sp. ZY19097 TaxID=3231906 RepID=UPI00345B2D83